MAEPLDEGNPVSGPRVLPSDVRPRPVAPAPRRPVNRPQAPETFHPHQTPGGDIPLPASVRPRARTEGWAVRDIPLPEESNPQLTPQAAATIQRYRAPDPDRLARELDEAHAAGRQPTGGDIAQAMSTEVRQNRQNMEWMRDAPRTAQLYLDPQWAAVAPDAVSGLSYFERGGRALWNDITSVGSQYHAGEEDVTQGRLGARIAMADLGLGPAVPDAERRQFDVRATARAQAPGPAGFFSNAARVAPQFVDLFTHEAPTRVTQGAAIGGMWGGLATAPVGGEGAPAGAAGGALIGLDVASVTQSFSVNTGAALESLRMIRDEQGRPLDDRTQAIAALAIGAVSGGLDAVSFERLTRLAGAGRILNHIITPRQALAIIQRPTVRQALGRIGIRYAQAVGTEAATEAMQQVVQLIGEEAARQTTNATQHRQPGNRFVGPSAGEAAMQVGQAGVMGGAAQAAFGIPVGGIGLHFETQAALQARRAQLMFENLANEAVANPLHDRSPRLMEEGVRRVIGDGPMQNFGVDAEGLQAFFQSQPDPQAAQTQGLEALGITQDQYTRALGEGGDITIETARYAARVAGTPMDAAMRRDMRLRPDMMTLREAEDFERNEPELSAAIQQQLARDQATVSQRSAEETQLRQQITDALRTTGRYDDAAIGAHTDLIVAGYQAAALRDGIPLPQVMAQFPIPTVVGHMAGERQTGGGAATRAPVPPAGIAATIETAARRRGGDPVYMTFLAHRESTFNANATPGTSSAQGPYQNTDGNWVGNMRQFGTPEQRAVAETIRLHNGRAVVTNEAQRQLMAARLDWDTATDINTQATEMVRSSLRRRLGRAPENWELYAVHFLGSGSGPRLLTADAGADAAALFPDAARSNPRIFYTGRGATRRGRTVQEVRENLAASFGGAVPQAPGGPRVGVFSTAQASGSAETEEAIPTVFDQRSVDGLAATQALAERYRQQAGITSPVHEDRATPRAEDMHAIADAFEAAQHSPTDPAVQAAYGALIRETVAQYRFMGNIRAEPWGAGGEPYRNSAEMLADVRDNGHLWYFPTEQAYGADGARLTDTTDHPMLQETEVQDIHGRPMIANDVFRIVHDIFGHTQGAFGFGPVGELNAYLEHAAMYSDAAKPALASETLMQNAWVNFGPHLRGQDGAVPAKGQPGYIALPDRRFADQKATVATPDVLARAQAMQEASRGKRQYDQQAVDARVEQHLAANDAGGFAGAGTLVAPPVTADGHVVLTHWSGQPGLTVTDPALWGRNPFGITGRDERQRRGVAPGRTYFGIGTGQPGGYAKEGGLGGNQYEATIPLERLYDMAADPDGLRARADEVMRRGEWPWGNDRASLYETVIRDAGYDGWWAKGGNGLVAAVYVPLALKAPEATTRTYFQTVPTGFYSGLQRAVEEAKITRAGAEQWWNTIRNLPGVKAEELHYSGLEEWLKVQAGTGHNGGPPLIVTKADVLAYVNNYGVSVDEVILGEDDPGAEERARDAAMDEFFENSEGGSWYVRAWEEGDDPEYEGMWAARNFHDYDPLSDWYETEDEAQEYADEQDREVEPDAFREYWSENRARFLRDESGSEPTMWQSYKLPGADNTYRELLLTLPDIQGPETHWSNHDNVFAHVRFTTREAEGGGRVLFIEELQSDWHQSGRKRGYKTPDYEALAEAAYERQQEAESAMRTQGIVLRNLVLPLIDAEIEDAQRADRRATMQQSATYEANQAARLAAFDYSVANEGSMVRFAGEELSPQQLEYGRLNAETTRTEAEWRAAQATAQETVRLIQRLQTERRDINTGTASYAGHAAVSYLRRAGEERGLVLTSQLVDAMRDWQGTIDRANDARSERQRVEQGGIPDAPFKEAWVGLAMKRMIRYAVDNGFDHLAWTNSEQIGPIVGAKPDQMTWFYSRNLPNEVNKIVKRAGVKVAPLGVMFHNDPSRVAHIRDVLTSAQAALDRNGELLAQYIAEGDQGRATDRLDMQGEYQRRVNDAQRQLDRLVGQQLGLPITPELRAQAGAGFTLFQTGPQTRSPEFREWFKSSRVTWPDGQPRVVYHGTLGDFDTFDPAKANIEGDVGGGFYFTTSQEDVGGNYASDEGADFQHKVELEMDRIQANSDTRITDDEARAMARAAIGQAHEGFTMPVYLSIQNPVVLGGAKETFFDYEVSFTEDDEDFGEPKGTLVSLLAHIREVAEGYDVDDIGPVLGDLEFEAMENGGVSAAEVYATLMKDQALAYAQDPETGQLATAEIIRRAFEAMGYDGIIDTTVDVKFGTASGRRNPMKGVGPRTTHYIAFHPAQIKSAVGNTGAFSSTDPNILHQDDMLAGPKRGMVEFPAAGLGQGRQAVIHLFEAADLSTFAHETGHFFLEMMLARAREGSASAQRDVAALLGWFNIGSAERITVREHEMFAEAFEQYLYEGRAPALNLRTVFDQFRSWLVFIYRRLKGVRLDMSDEVRGVMDRLLASDEQIAEARAVTGNAPLFTSADVFAGLRDENGQPLQADAYAVYAEMHARAVADAHSEADTALLGAVRRQAEDWWKRELDAHRERFSAELIDRPEYRALEWLAHGRWINGEPPDGLPEMKLSRDILDAEYGKERRLGLTRGMQRVYSATGGVHPDEAASWFGFEDGDQLVDALTGLETRATVAEREAQAAMQAEHGDPLNDGTIPAIAVSAVHNASQRRVLELELAALQGRPVTKGLAEAARRAIAGRQVSDVLNPDKHLRAERKAGFAAQEAFRKGDLREAAEQKFRQLVAFHNWRAAKDALEEVSRVQAFVKRLQSPGSRENIANSYLEQIDALLEQFDFKKAGPKELNRRQSLLDFLAQLADQTDKGENLGRAINIDPRLIADAQRRHYSTLTMDELRGLEMSLKNLNHLGRLKEELLSAQERRRFAAVRDELVAQMATVTPANRKKARDFSPGPLGAADDFRRAVHAWHTKFEFVFRLLDGLTDAGPVWNALFRPLAGAENTELDMSADYAARLKGIFQQAGVTPAFFKRKIAVPSLGQRFTRQELFSLALNWGNEGNRTAIREGYGWTDPQVEQALALLTEKEVASVQAIWDLIETLREPAFQLEYDLTGVRPEKVDATPWASTHGTLPGGYYPLVFDASRDQRVAEADAAEETKDMFGGNYTRPQTKQGHLIARIGSGGRPPRLDLSVLSNHVRNVIHDVTHRRALLDVDRLTRDKAVRDAFIAATDRQTYALLRPWLSNIARDAISTQDPLMRVFAKARTGSTVVNMGWKLTTAITQVAGILPSMTRVGVLPVLSQVVRVWPQAFIAIPAQALRLFGRPAYVPATIQYVLDKSATMRHRMGNFDRDVRDTLRRGQAGWTHDVHQSFLMFTGLMDMSVSVPTWLAAYENAKAGKVENVDPTDDEAAVAHADSIVRMTQGGGGAKDLAAVQTGNEFQKLFTGFYSYFSVLYNQLYNEALPGVMRGQISVPQFVAYMLFTWILPQIFADMLTDRWQNKDGEDDEHAWRRRLEALLAYPLMSIVMGRDVMNALISGRDFQLSSAAGAFAEPVQGVGGAAHHVLEGQEVTRSDVHHTVVGVGYWMPLPSRQMWLTGEYVYDWLGGNLQEPFNPYHALVTGEPRTGR